MIVGARAEPGRAQRASLRSSTGARVAPLALAAVLALGACAPMSESGAARPAAEGCIGAQQTGLPAYGQADHDLPPMVLHLSMPAYPAAARDAGVEGTVVIAALVCVDGRVYDVRRVVSKPMLDAAAEDAVRHSSFRPALKGGQPVAAWLEVPVEFRLP